MSELTMPEKLQQKRMVVLRPELRENLELRENKELEHCRDLRDVEKRGNAPSWPRPSNTVPHLYERTVELYLDILDMQAHAEAASPAQLRSFLQEAEQVVAGLIRKEAGSL